MSGAIEKLHELKLEATKAKQTIRLTYEQMADRLGLKNKDSVKSAVHQFRKIHGRKAIYNNFDLGYKFVQQ